MKYLTLTLMFFLCTLYADNDKLSTQKTPSSEKKNYATPLVLDMDGDKKLEASGGQWLPHRFHPKAKTATFDINGDHFAEFMEWVGPNDGLLVRYEKGEISGLNLFGDAGGFKHGFEKLSVLDKNNDKAISGEELKGLSVWQDKNGNAKIDKGEIKSVEDLKITSLSLKHRMFSSSFVQDGKTKSMWDWHPAIQVIKKIRKQKQTKAC